MRHAEADWGEQLDPTRELTQTGKRQAKMMAKWLARQDVGPAIVLQSNMKRSQDTAKRIAKRLDVEPITTFKLDPEGSPESAWRQIRKQAILARVESVVAVSHGPLVEKLLAMLIGCPSFSCLHFAHGAIAHFDTTAPMTEAKGEYTYEEQEVKRWVLGDGGASGENCETCEENADMGWIDMDATFLDTEGGDIDDVPAHPNDTCSVEYKTKRVRVYESGVREAVTDEGPFAYLHWLVTPNTVARDEDEMDAVTEAALAIADALLVESAHG